MLEIKRPIIVTVSETQSFYTLSEMACEMMHQFDDNDDDGIDIQELGSKFL